MDDVSRLRMSYVVSSIMVAVIATFLIAAMSPGAADAKGKKIHACVVKKGADKGVMHFSRTGKCHKGEKKLSWGKKARRGEAGPAGQTGATGPQGPSGVTDELLATIAAQQAKIDQLTAQLNALSPRVAALCSQMTAVTSQTNALGTAIGGLTLNGVLIGLGGVLNIPALPSALAPFTCP